MGADTNGKQVFFIGAWRAQQYSDQLLKQISGQIAAKKGFLTDLNITPDGLELYMKNTDGQVTRHDKIALENIVDFINNKYSTTCTLAIVRDKQYKAYTVFVFICKSDKDAAALIQLFKDTKSQLSGEGYNFDLTPKGHNWVLQNKGEPTVHKSVNGEVRVFTDNPLPSDHTDGFIEVDDMAGDTRSRVSMKSSSSEVKEELNHLAEEVRDIKRLLQGNNSRKKHDAENQYTNYRFVTNKGGPMIPVSKQFTEMPAKARSVSSTNPRIVYARNGSYNRYPEGGTRVIVTKGGSVPRSGKRHYASVSPTRAAYTRRVYESKSPHVATEMKRPVQQVRYVTQQQAPVMMPRMRSSGSTISHRSDVVLKNIEQVYRSRPSRRMYLPPRPMSPVMHQSPEVIYSEVREPKYYSQPKQREVQVVHRQMNGVHRQVNGVQRQVNGVHRQSNGPSTVHVKYNPEVRTYYDTNENTIIKDEDMANVSTHVNVSVNDGLDDKLNEVNRSYLAADDTIIVRTNAEVSRSAPEGEDVHKSYEHHTVETTREIENTSGGKAIYVKAGFADNMGNDAYNIGDTPVDESYFDTQQHNGTTEYSEKINQVADTYIADEITDEVTERAEVNNEDDGLFESHVKTPEEYNEDNDDVTQEKAVRYHDDVEIIEDYTETHEVHTNENIQNDGEDINTDADNREMDEGLFSAYTKTPEELGEPSSTVIAERAFRYHEDVEKTDAEDNGEHSEEIEKRVRYNDDVEEITGGGDIEHIAVEDRHLQATYEAAQPEARTEWSYGRGISDRIQRLNARSRGENLSSDDEDEVKEKDYQLDMDALRQYTSDPSVVIIDSEGDKRDEIPTNDIDEISLKDETDVYDTESFNEQNIVNDIDNISLSNENVDEIGENVHENVDEIGENVHENVDEIGDDVAEIGENLDEKVHEIGENVHENVDEIGENVDENVAEIRENFDDNVHEIGENVDENVHQFGEKVEDVNSELVSSVNNENGIVNSTTERVKSPITDELKSYLAKKADRNSIDADDVRDFAIKTEDQVLF